MRKDVKEIGNQVLTIPNALSLLRIVMVPVVISLLLMRLDLVAAIVFAIAALTDFLDGQIARMTQPTRLGKILDPIADRLMLSSSAIVLAARGLLPFWIVALLVARDLVALFGGLVYGGRVPVNYFGKAATALLMVAVALLIFSPSAAAEVLFYLGFTLSLLAGVFYALNVFRISGRGGTI